MKLLSCILLSTLTVTTCFLLWYLVAWLHEVITGRSAELDTLVAFIVLVAILSLGICFWV